MKKTVFFGIFSAVLFIAFSSFGSSPTNSFSKSEKKYINVKEYASDANQIYVPFAMHELPIEIPVNHIGFHNFVLSGSAVLADNIVPVAHGPSKRSL